MVDRAQIEFSEEQTMLLETAVNFCRERSPVSRVRTSIDQVETHDPALWQEITELGWLGIAVPEAAGGLGMGLASAVPVVESMGRYLMSSPYLATTLAIQSLVSCASDSQQQQWLPQLAEGSVGTVALTEEDGSWLLSGIAANAQSQGDELHLAGRKCQVLDALEADVVVVSVLIDGAVKLLALEKNQIPRDNIVREVVIDETRRSYSLSLEGVVVDSSQILPVTNFAAIESAALLLISAEMSGGLSAVLQTIVEYLNTRKQFDKYIGSYQALKHPTVDILLAEESAKSHVYHAATLMAQGESDNVAASNAVELEIALRMAKAQGSEAFAYAGDRAVQFHGGFGFTYECDAQLYLRRALWCQHQFGDERYHRQLLAPLLLD
jgi:alkylation response protein AidB-like acyl-CoA dehydrogenase